jgi:cation transport ATPase
MEMRQLIPSRQRAYFSSHPLGFCVAVGFAISGLVNLLFPHLVRESAVSLALPVGLYYAFSLTWAAGGVCAAWGLLRGVRNLEAGGDVLLATALLVNYISVIWVRASSGLSAIFLIFMALGFLLRARHLARSGYVVLSFPVDDVHPR